MSLLSERRFISISNVKPGMLLEFNYTKKDGGSGQYTVLVIDPDRKNDHSMESLLHAIDISGMSDEEIIETLASFQTQIDLGVDSEEDRKKQVVKDVNTQQAYVNLQDSKFRERRRYRTFIRNSVSRPRQILLGRVE